MKNKQHTEKIVALQDTDLASLCTHIRRYCCICMNKQNKKQCCLKRKDKIPYNKRYCSCTFLLMEFTYQFRFLFHFRYGHNS